METLKEEGAQLQNSSEQENSLQRAQQAVSALQDFNRHYFELHPLDKAASKEVDVKTKLKETLDLLESLRESLPKVQYWCSKGQALNVLPDYCQEAEECLSKAIKHDPTLIVAWNGLGETYWKAGKVQQAYDCFVGSLAHLKNKESLRNLSMVLRQLGKDTTEREANIKESVEKAKEAVGLDVKDGISWMVLGNAYISLFFGSHQDPKILKQCFSAYSQAEKDPIAHNNPDLHFNKATFYQYEESYEEMLRELSLSSALDPAWSTPSEKKETMVKFLKTMARLIDCKGKAKPKVLSSLASSLAQSHKHLGPESEKVLASCSELKEGVNSGRVFLGGVVCVIPWKERVPYACVMIDAGSNAVGLTLYNLSQSTNFSVGDIIAIPDPAFRHIQVTDNSDVMQYHAIRVDNPGVLLVNGQTLSKDKLAPSTVSITAFS